MRTPIRKSGKYTHLKPDPNMTKAKYQELEAKLKKLKKKRPFAIEEVKRLALMGDFSENAAYQIAKGRLRGLNQRILDTENLLKKANIITLRTNNDTVQLGCTVTLEINGQQKTYQILGSTETDPESGIISNNSPLGSSLMNHRVGDIISRNTPSGIKKYKIINIK